jgi:hypothetical protein
MDLLKIVPLCPVPPSEEMGGDECFLEGDYDS